MHLDIGVTNILNDIDFFYKLLYLKLVVDLSLIQINQQPFEPLPSYYVFAFLINIILIVIFLWVNNFYLLNWDQEILLL